MKTKEEIIESITGLKNSEAVVFCLSEVYSAMGKYAAEYNTSMLVQIEETLLDIRQIAAKRDQAEIFDICCIALSKFNRKPFMI